MMRLIKSLAFSLLFIGFAQAQITSEVGVWLDHLPYGSGIGILQRGDNVYAASRKGLFVMDKVTKDIQRFSKLSGLSDINISAIAYSDYSNELIIGYENANLDIMEGENAFNLADIKLSANFPGLKTINHLLCYENLVYISTDFGIVVVDLDDRIVKETYIIGTNGAVLQVNQVAINPVNDSIYAATPIGILAASRSTPLQFFASWTKDPGFDSNVKFITAFNNTVFATKAGDNNNDSIFIKQGKNWVFSQIDEARYSFVGSNNNILSVCNNFSAQGYDTDLTLKYNVNSVSANHPDYSPQAAVVDEATESYWTIDRTRGIFLVFQRLFVQNFNPNSPSTDKVYRMHAGENGVFLAPGELNEGWTPLSNNSGFSVYRNFSWKNIPNSEFNGYQNVIDIITDPSDPSHYYFSAYGWGIVEMKDDKFVRLINAASVGESVLPSINGGGPHRIGSFTYDPDGNLWFTNSLTDKPLGVIRTDGTVQSYSLGSVGGSLVPVKDIMYTSEGQIWIQTRTTGIIIAQFNGANLEVKKMETTENSGNLPSERVLAFAEDNDGEVWIGTTEGVGVLYSPQNLFEPNRNFDAQPIIIDEDGDGLGDPFLGAETVNDIEVDGANKKWFATANSGVFYTSGDGRQEIYHFTKDNSPLISDNVLDIEIDDETGMVYFGTDQGLISFQGIATKGGDANNDVYAYPNPVEPGYTGPILIRGLVSNAQVKITDVEGNLVFETIAEGGQALWSGKDFSGNRAASGVYLAYITDDLGTATEVTKILIVN